MQMHLKRSLLLKSSVFGQFEVRTFPPSFMCFSSGVRCFAPPPPPPPPPPQPLFAHHVGLNVNAEECVSAIFVDNADLCQQVEPDDIPDTPPPTPPSNRSLLISLFRIPDPSPQGGMMASPPPSGAAAVWPRCTSRARAPRSPCSSGTSAFCSAALHRPIPIRIPHPPSPHTVGVSCDGFYVLSIERVFISRAGAGYRPPQYVGCGRRAPTIAVVGGQPLLQTQELILSALMGQGIAMPMQLSDGLNLDRAAVGDRAGGCPVYRGVGGGGEVPRVEGLGGGVLKLVACGRDVG